MSTISKPNTYSAGATIIASQFNENDDTIYNDYNGSINNSNVASNADIAGSKINADFGAQTITSTGALDIGSIGCDGTVTVSGATSLGSTLTVSGAVSIGGALTVADRTGIAQIVYTESGAVGTTLTQIPFDDSIPQITEGAEGFTKAITPTSATNILKIDVVALVSSATAGAVLTIALFQDTTAGALAMNAQGQGEGSALPNCIKFTHYMTAGTTSETTFRVRYGSASASETTLNGVSGGRIGGGVMASSITITEIVV